MSTDLRYDLFISYKSENAAVARAVGESLMGQGVSVWFAEYEVLLSNYARFQPAIDAGVDAARYALVFTNDQWAASPYCRLEADRIFRNAALDPSRILQVCIPRESQSEQLYPYFGEVPTLEFKGQINDVIDFVHTHTKLGVGSMAGPAGLIEPDCPRLTLGDGVSLCPGPLAPTLFTPGGLMQHRSARLHHLEGLVLGHEVHVLVAVNPQEAAITLGRPNLESLAGDDRAIYAANRRIAHSQLRQMGVEQQGLHLVNWNGRRHFAVTYGPWTYPDGRTAWERLYVLQLHSPFTADIGEITVSCFITGIPGTGSMSLVDFCFCAGFFEALVASIRYEPEKADASPPAELAPSQTAAAFSQRTHAGVATSTFLVPPPIGLLQSVDMLQPIFPPPIVPLCRRTDLRRLQSEFGIYDAIGWLFAAFYAVAILAACYTSIPAPPANVDPAAPAQGITRQDLAIAGILLGLGFGPVLALANLALFLRGSTVRYLEYVNRRAGYHVLPVMLIASAVYLVIALGYLATR